MTYSCIIVEDQPPAQRILLKYIDDLPYLKVQEVFSDALSAIEFLKSSSVDLIFLDIHLPKLSGFDFLKIRNPKSQVIITSAFPDYALEGYELNVCDYLLKPFSFDRFVKAVNKATADNSELQVVKSEEQSRSKTYFIKSGSEYLNLNLDEIRYIKSDGDYTCVYHGDRRYLVAHSLRYWNEQLPDHQFCQVHKSYIVGVKWISKVSAGQIILGDVSIPIGRMYKDDFFERFLKD